MINLGDDLVDRNRHTHFAKTMITQHPRKPCGYWKPKRTLLIRHRHHWTMLTHNYLASTKNACLYQAWRRKTSQTGSHTPKRKHAQMPKGDECSIVGNRAEARAKRNAGERCGRSRWRIAKMGERANYKKKIMVSFIEELKNWKKRHRKTNEVSN